MKPQLVELWKCRLQHLRPYFASWRPQQRDHPISSCHVWYLPLVWTGWCAAMAIIILLALYHQDMMDAGRLDVLLDYVAIASPHVR